MFPKFQPTPVYYDQVIHLSISMLKDSGFLKVNHVCSGGITWTQSGDKIGSINFKVNATNEAPFVVVSYPHNHEARKYMIQLVTADSNLGRGKLWLFKCPKTGKLCRKLYCLEGIFAHREAFKGYLYSSQAKSKNQRKLEKTIEAYRKIYSIDGQLNQKHFKPLYSGKATKRYLKVLKEIKNIKLPIEGNSSSKWK